MIVCLIVQTYSFVFYALLMLSFPIKLSEFKIACHFILPSSIHSIILKFVLIFAFPLELYTLQSGKYKTFYVNVKPRLFYIGQLQPCDIPRADPVVDLERRGTSLI